MGAARQPDVRVGLRACDPGVADHRVHGDARCVGVVPAQGRARRVVSPHRQGRADHPDPHDRHPALGRQPARGDRGEVPADEDRRRGGAVEQLPAVLVLGRSGRGVQPEQPDGDGDHPDPASAVGAGDRYVERSGHGAQPAPGAVSEEIRTRKLHTERGDPVLVDPGHGRLGVAGVAAGAVGRLSAAAGPAAEIPIVPLDIGVGGDHPVRDEHSGVVADRVRSAAVDRAGAPEDRELELAVGQRHRDLDQPDRVRPVLHRARLGPISS